MFESQKIYVVELLAAKCRYYEIILGNFGTGLESEKQVWHIEKH